MEKTDKQSIRQRVGNWLSSGIIASIILTTMILVIILVGNFLQSDWVGHYKPILDPELVVSIWIAELPLAYFVKYILGERVDRPVLKILDELRLPSVQSEFDPTYYEVTVWNNGATMAEKCDVSINIQATEFDLTWQPSRTEPVNIRPDRKKTTQIFRSVPLEHTLEFPTEKDWNGPKKLAFADYRGTISIGAENCKPAKREFTVSFDKDHNKVTVRLV